MGDLDKALEATTDKYRRAQTIMQGLLTTNMVMNTTIVPTWIEGSDFFWYLRETKTGKEYRLVNARKENNESAFNHSLLSEVLSAAVNQAVNKDDLPIRIGKITLNPLQVRFAAFEKSWLFDSQTNSCTEIDVFLSDWEMSPDGKCVLFDRDFNLWVRELESGKERQLTKDGVADFAYGAYGSAWGVPPGGGETKLQASWSPDGKTILTAQRDRRMVKELPVMHHVPLDGSIRPQVEFTKISYPGDEHIETLRIVAIDVQSGIAQEANYRNIPVTRSDWGLISSDLAWWAEDSRRAYFIDMERDYKTVRLVEFNTSNGETNILFKETSETQINLMLNGDERPALMPLKETNELLWFSERSGWAHLYLYDLNTGLEKNVVTQGRWVVRDLVKFDVERRELFIQTGGRVDGRDPLYRDLARVNIDTGELSTVISSDHEYVALAPTNFTLDLMKEFDLELSNDVCAISHNGEFAVVTRSRADEAPVSLLVDRTGREIMDVEVADMSGLPENWQWPEPVKMVAADGETEIYGLLYKPSDFSPEISYPVIDMAFCNPEYTFLSQGSFTNGILLGMPYFNAAALAELGFIVVQIDGRGVAFRDKAFQDQSYGWTVSASKLEDHVEGIRQLTDRFPYMDLDRVGIAAHLGGAGAVEGLLYHPEFFKVGVTTWMQDSRLMSSSMWGEKLEGLEGPSANHHYPEELAHRLEGKLLIMGGMLDRCTPPAIILRFVEALCKEQKEFDLLLMPNFGHDVDTYTIKRTWDYFTRHLLGTEPPSNFRLSTPFDSISMVD